MYPRLQLDLDHRRKVAEMQIVEQARAQSRAEASCLERMRHEARAVFFSNPSATEAEFERCWPQLLGAMVRRQANQVRALYHERSGASFR